MRVAMIAAGLVAGFAATANAADLPARAPAPYKAPPPIVQIYNWGGFYVGIDGGGASSHNCYTITNVNSVAITPTSEGCHDATGGLAGGQVGYRWQMASWVFGVEAQGDWANLKGSNGRLVANPIP